MTARRRAPRRTRQPEVRPKPWGDRAFPASKPAAAGPSQWADTEQWLSILRETGAITTISGGAGLWIVTDTNGVERRISAETDEETRVAHSILGTAAR